MPVKATELKRGQALLHNGQLHVILETVHVKPGKGPAYVQAKMKNIETDTIRTNRFNSSDRLDDVTIDRRTMQYLYDASGQSSGPFVFMDTGTFEQVEIGADILGEDRSRWLKEGLEVTMLFHDARPLDVELPVMVELAVIDTTPQAKGTTATNQLKEAVVETGARCRVPPFIEIGQVVRISTETGEYLGKA